MYYIFFFSLHPSHCLSLFKYLSVCSFYTYTNLPYCSSHILGIILFQECVNRQPYLPKTLFSWYLHGSLVHIFWVFPKKIRCLMRLCFYHHLTCYCLTYLYCILPNFPSRPWKTRILFVFISTESDT